MPLLKFKSLMCLGLAEGHPPESEPVVIVLWFKGKTLATLRLNKSAPLESLPLPHEALLQVSFEGEGFEEIQLFRLTQLDFQSAAIGRISATTLGSFSTEAICFGYRFRFEYEVLGDAIAAPA